MNPFGKLREPEQQELGFMVVWLVGAVCTALSPFWLLFVSLPFLWPLLLLIFAAPTVLLYMSVFAIPYVIWKIFRLQVARQIPILIGVVATACAGVILPLWLNAQTRAAVALKRGQSFGQLGTVPPIGGIALLTRAAGGAPVDCDKACRELVALSSVSHVIVGDGRRLQGTDGILTKYVKVSIGDCEAASRQGDIETTAYRYALGPMDQPLCIRGRSASAVDADVVHLRTERADRQTGLAAFLGPRLTSGVTEELLTKADGRFTVIARRLRFHYRLFNVPAWVALAGDEGRGTKVGLSVSRSAMFDDLPSRRFQSAAGGPASTGILDWFGPVP